jgi:flagellar biosynthesis component FlhA
MRMQATSSRIAAILTIAAALTVFTMVVGAQTRDVLARSSVAACASQQDEEQAQQQEQQSLDDMIQSEQEAEQQNEAAQQQAQLDEQLASQ